MPEPRLDVIDVVSKAVVSRLFLDRPRVHFVASACRGVMSILSSGRLGTATPRTAPLRLAHTTQQEIILNPVAIQWAGHLGVRT
jgi:hypothetical protein